MVFLPIDGHGSSWDIVCHICACLYIHNKYTQYTHIHNKYTQYTHIHNKYTQYTHIVCKQTFILNVINCFAALN